MADTKEHKTIAGKAGSIELIIEPPLRVISSDLVFVMCHPHPQFSGSMHNKVVTTATKAMQSLGLTTVRFNFRGVGESQGSYGHGAGEVQDLLAVLKYVHKYYPSHILWLGGFSFGGYIAYCGATEFPNIKELLLIAPGVEHFNFSNQAEPSMPLTIIQGDADETVPLKKVMAFLANVSASYHFIKLAGVEHFFHKKLITLKTELMQHFSSRLS